MPQPAAPRPTRPLVAALLAALSVSLLQSCGEAPRRFRSVDQVYAETLRHFDQDGDGSVSTAELDRSDQSGALRGIDRDGDGVVNVAELRQWTELTHPRPPLIKPIGEGGVKAPVGPDGAPLGPDGPAQGPPIPGLPQAPPLPGSPQGPPPSGAPQGPPPSSAAPAPGGG